MGLATGELDNMGTYAGRLASEPRHWTAMDEIIAGGHLGYDKSSTERRR